MQSTESAAKYVMFICTGIPINQVSLRDSTGATLLYRAYLTLMASWLLDLVSPVRGVVSLTETRSPNLILALVHFTLA